MARIFLTGGSGFIGGELVAFATVAGHEILNFDFAPPHLEGQEAFWVQGDVRQKEHLEREVRRFAPNYVIHMASDTDVSITELSQFTTTIDGTRNVIETVKGLPDLRRFTHVSTQFVVKPGVKPANETDLAPYTIYGEAKAETERLVRGAGLSVPWLIVRPTIIWGPHHPSFRENIFKHIGNRSYLHPTGDIRRAFGYVSNTAHQILTLTLLETAEADGHVFYAGDGQLDYADWADAFSVKLTGKPAKRIPKWLLRTLGRGGDVLKTLKLPAPIDSGRAFRMSTSSAVDLAPTLKLTGKPRIGFDEGVEATIRWLRG